jgi:hypothetical protein
MMMVIVKDVMGGGCSTHGKVSNGCKSLVGKLERNNHLEDLGVDGRYIPLAHRTLPCETHVM